MCGPEHLKGDDEKSSRGCPGSDVRALVVWGLWGRRVLVLRPLVAVATTEPPAAPSFQLVECGRNKPVGGFGSCIWEALRERE